MNDGTVPNLTLFDVILMKITSYYSYRHALLLRNGRNAGMYRPPAMQETLGRMLATSTPVALEGQHTQT